MTLTFGQALHAGFDDGTIPTDIPRCDGPILVGEELISWNGPGVFRTTVDGVPAIAWWCNGDTATRRYVLAAHPDIADVSGWDSWSWDANPLLDYPAVGWISEDQLTYPPSTP